MAYQAGRAVARTNGMATTSLIFGIAAIPLDFLAGLGIVPGVLGFIFGIIALRQIKQSGGTQGGRNLALTGLTIGAVVAVFDIFVAFVALLIPAVGAAAYYWFLLHLHGH